MKAAFLNKKGGAEALEFGEILQPKPGRGEVLIKVYATAVMPTELGWSPTWNTPENKPRPFPIVLSHEFSGVVASAGEGVTGWKTGDAVYGMNDWYANGAQAEYCVAPASAITSKPKSLDDAQAAVVPISALTAWQGLFDHGRLEAGRRVLIQGGAGAVGAVAVQLAHERGAHVIATASAKNIDFVRELGADEVIDYKASRLEDAARELDVVFDTVGGEMLARLWSLLRPGGRLVTIASQSAEATDERTAEAFFIVETNQEQLTEIGERIDAGKLRVFVEAVYPLARAREAYAEATKGGKRGKVAILVI